MEKNAYDFKAMAPINPYIMGIFKDTTQVNSCLTRTSTHFINNKPVLLVMF